MMSSHNSPHAPPETRRQPGAFATLWRRLTESSASIDKREERYQVRVLMSMLLALIVLSLLTLALSLLGLFRKAGEQETVAIGYRWLTLAVVMLLAVMYGLCRSRYFLWAEWLTVGIVWTGTFAIAILDPQDPQFLYFLVMGGLIGSLFLSTRATAAVFFVTMVGVLLLPILVARTSTSNRLNALVFNLAVGGLVVLATSLRQRYLDQLGESEGLLRELSVRDPLTGLFNRRYMEEILALEIIRAMRKEYPIGIIMVDIDHFKHINDINGHAAGDAVLVQAGNILRDCVRASDAACRYGGEEFVFVLPEASQKITQMRAEYMREEIRNLHISVQDQILEAVTVSIGVAAFPMNGLTGDAVLRAADDALYQAKDAGRDRVILANKASVHDSLRSKIGNITSH
ncbi:MAG: GGDEF domain-containing protein [Anaerolineales bacterium]